VIPAGHKANLATIQSAADAGHLAVVECSDKVTGKPVHALASIAWDGEEYTITPLAKLFDGNPFEELNPPRATA
jgi:hypothetical protein